jgi:putative copper resistance protein D
VDVRRRDVDDVSATFPVAVQSAFGDGGRFALPLATGTWLTVVAIVVLVGALLVIVWAGQAGEAPAAVPRLVRIGTASAVVISAGVLALSLLPQNEEAQGNPIEPDAQSIALGRQLYTQNCQQCHGEDGRGDGPLASTLPVPPADFRLHVPYHEDEFFFNVITNGLGSIMPSFGEQLTEEERWHIVNFLKAEFGNGEQSASGP